MSFFDTLAYYIFGSGDLPSKNSGYNGTTPSPLIDIVTTAASAVHHHYDHEKPPGPGIAPIDIYKEDVDVFIHTHNLSEIINNTWGNSSLNFTEPPIPEWHMALEISIKWAMLLTIIGTMFGMGCAIYWKDIVDNLWPPVGVIIGMCGQFIILPATAFGFSILFKLNPFEALGALIVSCCPGGSFSNFFTYWVEGELALSIIMTTFSSCIAFGGMPFNLWLYSGYYLGKDKDLIEVPYVKILIGLTTVVVPVIIGMVIRHFSEKWGNLLCKIMAKLGYIGFTFSLACYLILYWDLFFKCSPLLFASGVILPITGFTLAYLAALVCKQNHKICRTIGIETGSQNMPIALNIIFFSFEPSPARSQMALFPTIYGIFMLIEVFFGIILFRGVTYCRNKRNPPPKEMMNAIHESGTFDEKVKMNP